MREQEKVRRRRTRWEEENGRKEKKGIGMRRRIRGGAREGPDGRREGGEIGRIGALQRQNA